jgi:hypothetical protein
MNRFTAHTVNECECQHFDYGVSLLLTVLLFYEIVLLQQKALLCQVILVLNWQGYNEMEKFGYCCHRGA